MADSQSQKNVQDKESADLASEFDCSICYELLHEPVVGTCGHDFCKFCYDQWVEGKRVAPCPICKKPLPKDLGVCLRLRNTINKLFPEKAAKRCVEVEGLRRDAQCVTKRRRENRLSPLRSVVRSHFRRLQDRQARVSQTVEDMVRVGTDSVRRVLDWVHIPENVHPALLLSPRNVRRPERNHPQTSLFPLQAPGNMFLGGGSVVSVATTTPPVVVHEGSFRTGFQSMPFSNATASGEVAAPRPFFTMGRRSSAPRRFSRYSTRRRLRQVPTRFSPEFRLPPTTIPPMSDVMDM